MGALFILFPKFGHPNKGVVIINGLKASIVDRISMDFILVDVICIPEVKMGDTIVLMDE